MKKKINDKEMDKLMFEYLVHKTVEETFKQDSKKEVCLAIRKRKDGNMEIDVKGTTLELLIALVALEKEILTNYKISEEKINIIRDVIGTKTKEVIKNNKNE